VYEENVKNKDFSDRLLDAIDEKQSRVVVGLDPDYDKIPSCFKNAGRFQLSEIETIYDFNRCIIDVVSPFVIAVKPQIAFYERYGISGLYVFDRTVDYAKSVGLIVIGDCKRNDIGNTAKAYADAHIGGTWLDLDAVTINPYLGSDGVYPFLDKVRDGKKGVFVLVKTSNPSSGQIQDLVLNGGCNRLYEHVGCLVDSWGSDYVGERGFSSVGAVVGATFPEHANGLRDLMPRTIFLVPGYGAQGASGKDLVSYFNAAGYGAIVSASRSIIYPHVESGSSDFDISFFVFRELVRRRVTSMIEDVNTAVRSVDADSKSQ